MDLFMKLGTLNICQTQEEDADNLTHCVNMHIVKRVEVESVKGKGNNKNYQQKNRQHNNRNRDGDEGNFEKGSK